MPFSITDPRRVQEELARLDLYHGPIDGNIKTKATDDAMMGLLIMEHVPGDQWGTWDGERRLKACEQLIVRRSGMPIRIDGWVGEESAAAFQQFDAKQGAGPSIPFPDDPPKQVNDPPNTVKRWPKQTPSRAELLSFFGPVGTRQTKCVPPYPMFFGPDPVKAITCHELVAESLYRVLTAVLNHYGPDQLRKLKLDQFSGSLNVRPIRGTEGHKPTLWSMHSWGVAFDFDAGDNMMNDKTPLFAAPQYDAWFDCWEAEGAVSLWRAARMDAMHVQFARLK